MEDGRWSPPPSRWSEVVYSCPSQLLLILAWACGNDGGGESSAAGSQVMPLGCWSTSQLNTQTISSTGTAVQVRSVLTQANHAPVTPACIDAVASSGAHARECMCRAVDTAHIHGH
jgi:hypothetical protein